MAKEYGDNMRERGERILSSFFGAVQAEYPYETCADYAILRVYPWWPIKFIHLEVTREKLQDCWAWEHSYIGSGYSVHLDCRHSDVDFLLHIARTLESSLCYLKKQIGGDIYLPGRWIKSASELRLIEDMTRIPENENFPILIGCRLAQYVVAVQDKVAAILKGAGFHIEPKLESSIFKSVSEPPAGLQPNRKAPETAKILSGASRS